jgi:dynein heavy chain
VKSEIENWIKTLETMASNLEIWVEAQQYWVNLDPIFNTDLFQDFFGEKKQDFMECRQQFKRIMWSSYKNPKAIYNLMIQSRISTFQDLIVFYSDLQKKVHEYLEQKRIAFPRFFFLNDS